MESLAHEVGCTIFIEIGPDPVLVKMGRQCLPSKANFEWIPSLDNGRMNKDGDSGFTPVYEVYFSNRYAYSEVERFAPTFEFYYNNIFEYKQKTFRWNVNRFFSLVTAENDSLAESIT